MWGGAFSGGFTSEPVADGVRVRPGVAGPPPSPPVDAVPPEVAEAAQRCIAERFVSVSIDLVESSVEPGPTEVLAQEILARDHAVTRWDLVEATAGRRTWAGSADGEVLVVFAVVQHGDGWSPDGVRVCGD